MGFMAIRFFLPSILSSKIIVPIICKLEFICSRANDTVIDNYCNNNTWFGINQNTFGYFADNNLTQNNCSNNKYDGIILEDVNDSVVNNYCFLAIILRMELKVIMESITL